MSYIGNKDYRLQVLRGKVSGHSMVPIEGHDDELANTQTTIAPTLASGNIDQSGLTTTPATVDVASTDANDTSAGTGLQTVTLTGLDSSGDAQSETISMSGQTEVTSANTYSAVHGLRSLTWGAGNTNAGTVWCGNGTFTAGVPATKYVSMHIGHNVSMTAYYVVPNGKTLYARHLTLQLGTASKDVEFYVEHSSNGINWFTEQIFELESGSEFGTSVEDLAGFPAGEHVRIEAVAATAGSTKVTAILTCELITD